MLRSLSISLLYCFMLFSYQLFSKQHNGSIPYPDTISVRPANKLISNDSIDTIRKKEVNAKATIFLKDSTTNAFLQDNIIKKKEYFLQKMIATGDTNYSTELDTAGIKFPFYGKGILFNKAINVKYDVQPIIKLKKDFWIFYVLLLLAILLTYVWYGFKKYIESLFRSLLNIRAAKQNYQDYKLNISLYKLFLTVNFCIISGLYSSLLIKYFHWYVPINGFLLFLTCTLIISSFYLIRYLILKLTAFIFPFKQQINFYNFNIALINKVLGIILFPIVVLMAYADQTIVLFIIIFSLLIMFFSLIFIYLRVFAIGKVYLRFYKFYFFVYLCTLEIAPLLIIIKGIEYII